MSYLRLKVGIKRFLRKRRENKYIKILVRREKAEVTIETAIVFTLIMILIGSMIFFGLYLHDKVSIRAYAYSGLVDGADEDEGKCQELVQSKMSRTPVFVIRPSARISGDFNRYCCDVSESEMSAMTFLDKIMTLTMGKQEVEVVKKMPIDKMYLFKAIKDGIKK